MPFDDTSPRRHRVPAARSRRRDGGRTRWRDTMGWTDEELDAWVAEERRKERRAARREFWESGPGAVLIVAALAALIVAPFWIAAALS